VLAPRFRDDKHHQLQIFFPAGPPHSSRIATREAHMHDKEAHAKPIEAVVDSLKAHLEHGPQIPTVNCAMHIYPINGACHRVPADATAFAYRDATFATVIAGAWPEPADNQKNIKWVRDYYAAIAPHSAAGAYVNFLDADDSGRVEDSYKGNYVRRVSIKQKYDPENMFHLNQNIKP